MKSGGSNKIGKSIYFNLLWRLSLLIVSGFGIVFIVEYQSEREFVFTLVVGILLILIQIIFLTRYVMRINRVLVEFVDSGGVGNSNDKYATGRNSMAGGIESRLNILNTEVSNSKFEELKQREFLDIVVNSMNHGILCVNGDHSVVFSNSAAKEIFENRPIETLNDLRGRNEELAKAIMDSISGVVKIITLPKFKASIRCKEFKVERQGYFLFSIQNIQQESDQQETLSWQKLLRVLTHEIMNSMAPILSLSKSLVRSGNDLNKVKSGLETIEKTGEGLIKFMEDYKKLSALPPPEKAILPVKGITDHMEALFHEEFALSKIEFFVSMEDPAMIIEADKHQVEQVLINLLSNSIDGVRSSESPRIGIYVFERMDKIHIEVEDNGKGIDKVNVDKVFVPFFTTKIEGTGVGLSLSRQIMNNHEGSIELISLPNERTVFSVTFPVWKTR